MFMITYIADVRPGEPDILGPVRHGTLSIRSLEGVLLAKCRPPKEGWSIDSLVIVQPVGIAHGAEAYIESVWVGSTEV